jgi:hypothetical protein
MAASVATPDDLQQLKTELLEEIKKLLSQRQHGTTLRWLKSHQVRRLLTISPGTLQQLRIKGTLPFTRIGGIIFYDAEDVEKMLATNKRNLITTRQDLKCKKP